MSRSRELPTKAHEVLAFLGIGPDLCVLDFNAATGAYTEILAAVVGSAGRVIAHNHPAARGLLAPADFERRYEGNRLPNVRQLFARHDALGLAAESLDAVLMAQVYHDTYWHRADVDWGPVDRLATLAALRAALRPGGVVGVIDHQALPGADPHESVRALHRIDAAVVRADFAAAGLVLEAESGMLGNPADDRSRSVFDPALAGCTDRFVMRFRRPR